MLATDAPKHSVRTQMPRRLPLLGQPLAQTTNLAQNFAQTTCPYAKAPPPWPASPKTAARTVTSCPQASCFDDCRLLEDPALPPPPPHDPCPLCCLNSHSLVRTNSRTATVREPDTDAIAATPDRPSRPAVFETARHRHRHRQSPPPVTSERATPANVSASASASASSPT